MLLTGEQSLQPKLARFLLKLQIVTYFLLIAIWHRAFISFHYKNIEGRGGDSDGWVKAWSLNKSWKQRTNFTKLFSVLYSRSGIGIYRQSFFSPVNTHTHTQLWKLVLAIKFIASHILSMWTFLYKKTFQLFIIILVKYLPNFYGSIFSYI